MKQVIVVRKDLNMRKGKMAAQVAHASMAFLAKEFRYERLDMYLRTATVRLPDSALMWLNGDHRKIVVGVDSLAKLDAIEQAARAAGIRHVHRITDNGLTEFHGQPTDTCICLGPEEDDKIDGITRELKLL